MAYDNSGRGRYQQGRPAGGYQRGRSQQGGGGQQQRDFSGVLFENDRKENDNHPDMRGRAMIGGVEVWVSAWWKRPNNGGPPFLSLSFTAMNQQTQGGGPPQHQGGGGPPQGNPYQQARNQQQFDYGAQGRPPGPGSRGGQWRDQGGGPGTGGAIDDEIPF